MKVSELIEQLINAAPDSVVVYLDSYASAYESDEVRETFVDAQLWTHETGLRHGEYYEIRYPYAPEPAEGRSHNITAQFLEHVVVLSDGPTNLRYLTRYQPSKRQQKLIKRALASHRWAQAIGRYAPSRLVRKWTSESPTSTNEGGFAQRKKRRFLGVSRSSARGLMMVPSSVRNTLRLRAGTRLWWHLLADGSVSLKVERSRR
jgi:hypothetical protein